MSTPQVSPEASRSSRGSQATEIVVLEDTPSPPSNEKSARETAHGAKPSVVPRDAAIPLITGKLANLQTSSDDNTKNGTAGYKKQKVEHNSPPSKSNHQSGPMTSLLAKLSEQHGQHAKQEKVHASDDNTENQHDLSDTSSGSVPLTPASDSFSGIQNTGSTDGEKTIKLDTAEVLRMKKELDAAKHKIARQEEELSHTRVIKDSLNQTIGMLPNDVYPSKPASGDHNTENPQDPFLPTSRPTFDDNVSEFSDNLSASGFMPAQNIWTNNYRPSPTTYGNSYYPQQPSIWSHGPTRTWSSRPLNHGRPPLTMAQQQQRTFSGPSSPTTGGHPRFMDFNQLNAGQGLRRANTLVNRAASNFSHTRNSGWDGYSVAMDGPTMNGLDATTSFQPVGVFQGGLNYHPRPIGTPLSPTAEEFTIGNVPNNPWSTAPSQSSSQTYVQPMEPMNYRRLLDRSVTCNWKYIVDKIVCNNDQQASIFLQQKLKVGTAESKYEIVDAIVAQAYPLMVNRFGNFLVQRCFEHGTPEQVIAIANAIRGNTLSLSMDAFGCHVVQKAFDAVPEDYKAIMVHELLRRIPETVIHRYACHVWQKLFELRWSDSPPQIMKYVNEALRGMWHEVALGETGSLVVQNIFENCLEEDKRPCINEVLASIDIVAHGQFGNWCIQHICEHGAPTDRSRAIDHVLRYATEYSMDQYASKVVEKCLKIGGPEFLERYLERVCEGRSDRPRIPLIDIASDQYGNYLIQYILSNANTQHREAVASHIRKHMVSLRGSKFGSRVGILCCNPAYTTRPGPGAGPPINRFNSSNNTSAPRFGGAYR